MKNLFIEPDEEIVSIIDRLAQVKSSRVNLIVPQAAQLCQSSINLKLLKREADSLGKEVVLILSDETGLETAEKIGFEVKKESEMPIEFIREEEDADLAVEEAETAMAVEKPEKEEKEDLIQALAREFAEEKRSGVFNVLQKNKKKESMMWKGSSPQRMTDIVKPEKEGKINHLKTRFFKKEKTKPDRAEAPLPEKTEAVPKPLVEDRFKEGKPFYGSKIFFLFVGLAFGVALVVSYLALSRAEIIVYPQTEEMEFELAVRASQDVSKADETLNQIPLKKVEIEEKIARTFPATGEKQLNEKARGTITIYNEYSSEPQTLVATTRFSSPDGKIFRIPHSVVVPGAKIEEGKIVASGIDVEVVADQPGPEYNIGPTKFTIPGFKGSPKYAGFYAESKTPMTGGATGKVKVVLAEDLEKAQEELVQQLEKKVETAIKEQVPAGFEIVRDGIKSEIIAVSADAEEGSQAEEFKMEVTMRGLALVFEQKDLQKLVESNLIAQIPQDKIPLPQTREIKWVETQLNWEKEEALVSFQVKEKVGWQVDIDALKNDLRGKNEIEVRKYFSNQTKNIRQTKVGFWPFWVKKVPKQKDHIKIEVKYED